MGILNRFRNFEGYDDSAYEAIQAQVNAIEPAKRTLQDYRRAELARMAMGGNGFVTDDQAQLAEDMARHTKSQTDEMMAIKVPTDSLLH